jgi:hypothetical protein
MQLNPIAIEDFNCCFGFCLGLLFLSFTRPRPTTHDQALAVEVTAGELTNWVSGDRLPVLCHRWAVVAGRIRPRSVHERGVDQRLSCLHAMKRGLEYSRRTFIVFCLGLGRPLFERKDGTRSDFFPAELLHCGLGLRRQPGSCRRCHSALSSGRFSKWISWMLGNSSPHLYFSPSLALSAPKPQIGSRAAEALHGMNG